jgi:hypothetical protein
MQRGRVAVSTINVGGDAAMMEQASPKNMPERNPPALDR